MGWLDRRLVAWMMLVLALLLPVLMEAPPAPLTPGEHDMVATLSASSHDAPDEAPAPDEDEETSKTQGGASFEDDVVLDHSTYVLVVMELKRPRAMILEPDSRHTRRLERPPIRAA